MGFIYEEMDIVKKVIKVPSMELVKGIITNYLLLV